MSDRQRRKMNKQQLKFDVFVPSSHLSPPMTSGEDIPPTLTTEDRSLSPPSRSRLPPVLIPNHLRINKHGVTAAVCPAPADQSITRRPLMKQNAHTAFEKVKRGQVTERRDRVDKRLQVPRRSWRTADCSAARGLLLAWQQETVAMRLVGAEDQRRM